MYDLSWKWKMFQRNQSEHGRSTTITCKISPNVQYYLSSVSLRASCCLYAQLNLEYMSPGISSVPLCLPPVPVSGEQCHSWRLQPATPHLQLHQRARLRLPPAQPEERPSAEALRWPQVRREEDRGGGVRPVHPRPGEGARVWDGQVEAERWRTERSRDLPEDPSAENRKMSV